MDVEPLTVTIHYSYTGSLAAIIQSSVYAGSTGGIFSALQSFGATAVVAPPVALALGGTLLVVGAGVGGYWLYQRRQRRLAAEARAAGDDDDSDSDDEHPPKEIQPLIKRVSVSQTFFLYPLDLFNTSFSLRSSTFSIHFAGLQKIEWWPSIGRTNESFWTT
jgi:hypothetical protein